MSYIYIVYLWEIVFFYEAVCEYYGKKKICLTRAGGNCRENKYSFFFITIKIRKKVYLKTNLIWV